MDRGQFLILHGYTGSGPGHWQSWLAERLSRRGHDVRFPTLPQPDSPHLDEWLSALGRELGDRDPDRLVVLAHSLGSLLWLHHVARHRARIATRVLLVAPPGPHWSEPSVHGFSPAALDADGIRTSADETCLIGTADDPYCTEAELRDYASEAGLELVLLPDGGHLNTEAGFGPWPPVEDWALHGTAIAARSTGG